MAEKGRLTENGWEGDPLTWLARPWWCKFGLHRWGAPWCLDCGKPDVTLQGAIHGLFEEARRLGMTAEIKMSTEEEIKAITDPPSEGK